MSLFKNKKRERMMQLAQSYKPTSKASLKQYCLIATQCNVDEAQKLYDFMIKDMDELPMFDPVPPNWVDNTKNVVSGFFDFVKEHQEGLSQGYEIVRSILGSKGKNLPAINNTVADAASKATSALPPIN